MKYIEVQLSKTCWLAVEHPQQAKRWHRLLGYESDDYIWIGNEFSRFRVGVRDIEAVRAVSASDDPLVSARPTRRLKP